MKGGIVLLDKEGGMSSAAAIARVKKRLSLNKIGHAGTLDPMATGLLVCLTNGATRLASFAEKGRKTYSGIIRLGLTTNTDDKEGETLTESEEIPDFPAIEEALKGFRGEIQQVPPQVSAIKVGGERAYRMVWRGETPKLQERKVQIYRFDAEQLEKKEISFIIECSSGTYIRSIARDLGEVLGCGACLWTLRRENSHPFSVAHAKKIDELDKNDVQPWITLFPNTAQVSLETDDARRLKTGDIKSVRGRLQEIITPQVMGQPETVIYRDQGSHQPLGLLKNVGGIWEIGLNLE